MACNGTCACVIRAGSDNVTVTGAGSQGSPIYIAVDNTVVGEGGDHVHSQYAEIEDAAPLASSLPLGGTQNGHAGTAATAARGDHRHPLPLIAPNFLRDSAGTWQTPYGDEAATGLNIGMVQWMPYFISRPGNGSVTIDRMAVYCNTAGSADASLRIGFYANGANDRPTTLLTSATIPAGTLNSTGSKEVTVSNYTFPSAPWFGWVGVLPLGTTAPVLRAPNRYMIRPLMYESPGVNRAGPRLDGQSALPSPATTFTAYANDATATVFLRLV